MMSRNELIAKIETLQSLEALIEETKSEAETVRNSIKAEMEAADTEELSAGGYIVRWTSVLTTRFDIQRPSRKSSEKKSTKPLPNRFPPGASLSVHKKSPLSDRRPSTRQRAISHITTERYSLSILYPLPFFKEDLL